MTEATARPWKSGTSCIIHDGKNDIFIALGSDFGTSLSNCQLVCRAVNRDHLFDRMVPLLEKLARSASDYEWITRDESRCVYYSGHNGEVEISVADLREARAVLAQLKKA